MIMPYILSIIGVCGMLVIGTHRWWGWLIAFTNECLWVAFAVATRQYGFILGAAFYGTVNAFNAYRWRNA
jgi:vancomycin permeability regulator SanA